MDGFINKDRHLKLLKELHEYSFELSEKEYPEMFDFIVSKARDIFSVKACWISTYDPDSSELLIQRASLTGSEISIINNLLKKNVVGTTLNLTPEQYEKMITEKISPPLSLKEVVLGSIPETVCDLVQKTIGFGWFTGVSLVNHGKLFGNIFFAGFRDQAPLEEEELLIFRAITSTAMAKKMIETQLLESEKRYRSISENSFDMICLLGMDGSYKYCNESYMDILGFSKDEVMSLKPFSLVHSEDIEFAINTFRSAISEKRKDATVTVRLLCKDGSYKWVEHRGKAIKNENDEPDTILINAQDVTARKNYEEMLIKAKEAAESANKAKSDFLSNMTHELRTPLCGIIGFTDLLETETKLDETQTEFVQMLKSSAKTLLDLVNDTLDLSKIEAGKLELHTQETDLKALFNEVFKTVEPLAKEKGISASLIMPETLPKTVITDPLRLKQILLNLTGNAVKFTNSGFINLRLEYSEERKELPFLKVSVEDSGIGIDPDKLHKVTENFYQADTSATRKFSGTGLGLAITDKLLKKMNSSLEISSTPEKGSVFSFRISFPRK
jgi:PAS domain S-box-containing protein